MSVIEQHTSGLFTDPFNYIKRVELSPAEMMELSTTKAGLNVLSIFYKYRTTSILLKAKADQSMLEALKHIAPLIDNDKLPLDIHVAATYWNEDKSSDLYQIKGNDLIFDITQSLVRPKEVLEINRQFTNIQNLRNVDIYTDEDILKDLINYLTTLNLYSYDAKELVFNALLSSKNKHLIDLFSNFFPESFSVHLWTFPCQIDYLKEVVHENSSLWFFLNKNKEKELIEYECIKTRKMLDNF